MACFYNKNFVCTQKICLFFLVFLYSHSFALIVNGSARLASKRYNEVVYATSHNGQSFLPSMVQNQDRSITEQLEAGIRAFKIPVWYDVDDSGVPTPCACHGISKEIFRNMYLGKFIDKVPMIFRPFVKKIMQDLKPAEKLLADALEVAYGQSDYEHGIIPFKHCVFDPSKVALSELLLEIRAYVDRHPLEIITLILEDYTGNLPLIAGACMTSGIIRYVHVQEIQEPWPTLAQMIQAGKRVVIFIKSKDDAPYHLYPWLHYVWNYAFDTEWDFKSLTDMHSEKVPKRGLEAYNQRNAFPRNKLFIAYHFITPLSGGSKWWASRVNKKFVLKSRLDRLQKETGHIVNFVQVDFFEYPHNDIFVVVNELNGIQTKSKK